MELIKALESSKKVLLNTELAYADYVCQVASMNQHYYNDLIKNINDKDNTESMGLKEIIDSVSKGYSNVKDGARFAKAGMYCMDAEKYKLIGDTRTYNYFRRRCTEEFKKLTNPDIITKFKEELGAYLPKKYLK